MSMLVEYTEQTGTILEAGANSDRAPSIIEKTSAEASFFHSGDKAAEPDKTRVDRRSNMLVQFISLIYYILLEGRSSTKNFKIPWVCDRKQV